MLVKDLIVALSQMPPDSEVMIDVTNEFADMFTHKAIGDVADVSTEVGDYVLLIPEIEFYGSSLN